MGVKLDDRGVAQVSTNLTNYREDINSDACLRWPKRAKHSADGVAGPGKRDRRTETVSEALPPDPAEY